MKSRFLLISCFLVWVTVTCLISSCGNGVDTMKLIAERDSLRMESEIQAHKLKNIEAAVSMMNETLDSIAYEEKLIFVNVGGELPVTRQGALNNLAHFEEVVRAQHKKIAELEAQLKESAFNEEAQQLIEHLRAQILQKDREIAELRKELEKKDVDIARLRSIVESQSLKIAVQTEQINDLDRKTKMQDEALVNQDKILNTGYVIVGSKKDLQRRGVLDKKGKIVANSMLDKSKFVQVDIRTYKDITFQAKRPRILTNMPQNSYSLMKLGNQQFAMTILSPADFWRISNYLVIQTD